MDELEFDNEFMKKKEEKPAEPPNLDYLDEQTLLEEEIDNDEKESESDNEQFSLEDTAKHAREFLEEDLSAKFIKVNVVNIIIIISLCCCLSGSKRSPTRYQEFVIYATIIQQSVKILTKGNILYRLSRIQVRAHVK